MNCNFRPKVSSVLAMTQISGIISVAFKKYKIKNVNYSPKDNFSPESEGSVKPKMEVQSKE